MAQDGWIKCYRSIMDSAVWDDEWLVKLWLWCLLRANHQKRNFKGVDIERGQFVTGRMSAADELGVSPSKWYRGMERLVSLGCITTTANSNWTTVTVCNYGVYQDASDDERTANEQQMNSQRTANEQPADTIEECKNVRMEEDIQIKERVDLTESTEDRKRRLAAEHVASWPMPHGDESLRQLVTNWQAARKEKQGSYLSVMSWEAELLKWGSGWDVARWRLNLITSAACGSQNVCANDLRAERPASNGTRHAKGPKYTPVDENDIPF